MRSTIRLLVKALVICSLFSVTLVSAQDKQDKQDSRDAKAINVAVAANFAAPLKAYAEQFSRITGIEVNVTVASSGTLFAQIQHGAKFDVFLSADTARPQALIDAGKVHKDNMFHYAQGQLAFVYASDISPHIDAKPHKEETYKEESTYLSNLVKQVTTTGSGKLAVANPLLAPYGEAAKNTLTHLDIWDEVQPSLVVGKNILQAYQYFTTGGVKGAFVAYSLVNIDSTVNTSMPNIHVIRVPEAFYQPITQALVINSNSKAVITPNVFNTLDTSDTKGVEHLTELTILPSHLFVQYLLSDAVQSSLPRWGYKRSVSAKASSEKASSTKSSEPTQ